MLCAFAVLSCRFVKILQGTILKTLTWLALVPLPAAISADTTASAARELAEKITAATGPLENVQLSFRNRSSLNALGAEEAFKTVERALRAQGMRFGGESEATVRVTVTLSENPENLLWIAEIQRDSGRDLVMVAQSKPAGAAAAIPSRRMELRMNLIIEQNQPALDVVFEGSDLLVLDPGHLSRYRRQNDRWALQEAVMLPAISNLPRDPRGKLSLSGGILQAWLPGLSCSSLPGPTLALDCTHNEASWPLEMGPAKLEPGKNSFVTGELPSFYSIAAAGSESARSWIFTGVDGRAHLVDENLKPVGTISGWGSDVAGVQSACGSGRQIIATLPGDSSEAAGVQAFEIVRRQAVAVTPAVDLSGPVTALWPLASHEAAIVVSRDIKSGHYVVYQLSVVCGP